MLKRRRPSSSLSPPTSESPSAVDDDKGREQSSSSRDRDAVITEEDRGVSSRERKARSFRVAKWAMLRLLGMVYFFAFIGAFYQNRGLLGSDGLQPANSYMFSLRSRYSSNMDGFFSHPTLYWWVPLTDATLDGVALFGMALSSLVALGIDSWLVLLMLWLLDFTIVTAAEGSSFYSYGWESQLLETGFLAVFLCDFPSLVRTPDAQGMKRGWTLRAMWRDDSSVQERVTAPSTAALWLMRWLCFRISLGAGLIKVRGGSCWAEKTCLHYHFETQPIPSPMSFIFHFLPKSVLSRAVDLDLFVQLYSSWMVMVPGWVGRIGGFIQAAFMVNILLSGNFAFLNHVTIIPALACLDDACWPEWFRSRVLHGWLAPRGYHLVRQREHSRIQISGENVVRLVRLIIDVVLVVLIGGLSIPVVANLLQWGGGHQKMNASFNAFRLVNTYGAFGSVGHARYEPIVSVSSDGKNWNEVEFPCKPGNLTRRPCFSAPYHYRLDWNIWFIGFKPHEHYLNSRERWLYGLLAKMLRGERGPWTGLLDRSAEDVLFAVDSSLRIQFAKVDMYHYTMANSLWKLLPQLFLNKEVTWWNRRFEQVLIPPVIADESGNLRHASD